MGAKVADASVLAAVLFDEPEAERALELLDDATLSEPALLLFELTNVAWKKARKSPKLLEPLVESLRLLGSLRIDWVDVDSEEVLRLAVDERITAYDASYLWLSRRLGVPLVTFDEKLSAVRTLPSSASKA